MIDPTFTHQVAIRLYEDRLEEAMRQQANPPATLAGLLESVRAWYSQLRQRSQLVRAVLTSRTLFDPE